ncbi:MAG TPA: DNA-processing protein DprA [Solirubrobacteraceae bacterium]|nr:DNA-processing protein DprA [Solirubrobacteraceae bacterium]
MGAPTDCGPKPATQRARALRHETNRRVDGPPRARADPLAPPIPILHTSGANRRLSELLARPCVAIVGARHSTYYGQETAAKLARELAQAGLTIVAGLTEGIEASAHHAVLAAGRPTIAVVPGSPDTPYPLGQKHLHAKVNERGSVVGTAQQTVPTDRSRRVDHDPLLDRNSLIAQLAQVVILIEATRGAAAIHTAERALELGREVAAVPGRITDESADGPNRLIRDGAHPILEAKDVLDLLG